MSNSKKKRLKDGVTVLAHENMAELAYYGTEVPDVVPLYADFDLGRRVGRVVLTPVGPKIYATIFMDFTTDQFGQEPQIVLAAEGCRRTVENGVKVARGGSITGAAVVNKDTWEGIYGKSNR